MNDEICSDCKNQLDDCECIPYISPSELDMEIPPFRSFTKHVKLTKVESKPIIDLGDDFSND